MISSSLIFSDRMCGIITILLAVSGMDFSRCQPLCSHLIASDEQHGKCIRCMGLAHGWDATLGISNCKYCENFTLKALHARPTVFDQESAFLPCRATLEASSLCEAAAWSSDAELEAMESEVFSLSIAWASLREFFVSSFIVVVLHPARRHRKPFPSGWRIFCLPLPPNFSGLHWAGWHFGTCHWEVELRLAGRALRVPVI